MILGAAIAYAARGWPVFPCNPEEGPQHKRPLTERGFHDASVAPVVINRWWGRWFAALIGVPTGAAIGAVVLDVDVKRPETYGYDTLADLGYAILPDTPMAHTASGGLHLYFSRPPRGLRNTGGARGRGIGPGLDWRGDGGYVIVPSPGSGYSWDPHWNFETMPLAEVPATLLPREVEREGVAEPVKPEAGLSRYAEAALDAACRRIITAPFGEQETTINGEAFAIGTLAGANGIPAGFARRALIWAATGVPSYDTRRRWQAGELTRKVERAFADGMRHPRETRLA
jgi:hypothetical protein